MRLVAPNIRVFSGLIESVTLSSLPAIERRRFGKRLVKLHKYLGSLKPAQYNHGSLVTTLGPTPTACGTVACAFGHAVLSGEFKDIPVTASVKRGVKPDADGKFEDNDITFKALKGLVRSEINRLGVPVEVNASGLYTDGAGIDTKTAADVYFGPGAWKYIFDVDAYPWHNGYFNDNRTSKAIVMRRIRAIAKNAYGVEVVA